MCNDYDVIIIGGRCAGASLAIRLAQQNLKVLVVDRASFPSLPSVASTPLIHPGTMNLMDELGIPESAYAHPDSRIENYATIVGDLITTVMPTSRMKIGRDYFYGGDRSRFDNALWSELSRYPTITARDCFSVTAILKDENGKAIGITGKPHGQPEEKYTADLVVGADGRFSFAARQFGAKVTEERNQYITASYHAEWENVEDFSPHYRYTFTLYNNLRGIQSLFIPIATHKYIVSLYIRADYANFGAQKLESAYHDMLKTEFPQAWKRLKNAHQVTQVMGVRKIENGYREAFGDGWALVGDAVHYKDPVDGQGMYDALLEAKLLAETIAMWKSGMSWREAGECYEKRMVEETYPMFNETMKNVQRRFYSNPPSALKDRLMLRWMITDPQYQAYTFKYLSRAIKPTDPPPSNRKVMLRGIVRDLTMGMILL